MPNESPGSLLPDSEKEFVSAVEEGLRASERGDLVDQADVVAPCESRVGPRVRLLDTDWRIDDRLVPYPEALIEMDARAAAIRDDDASELVWLLEHPPLYTAGTSAKDCDLLDQCFPVYRTGRGGQFTYHGPGQRVAYLMLDLKRRNPDVRAYVRSLEEWIIRALARFNVIGERRDGRVGIWVDLKPHGGLPGQEAKIAAIGVRVRRWVTMHGVALNVEPDLSHYAGIVPCGISDQGVTSLVALGLPVTMADVDAALRAAWDEVFGR